MPYRQSERPAGRAVRPLPEVSLQMAKPGGGFHRVSCHSLVMCPALRFHGVLAEVSLPRCEVGRDTDERHGAVTRSDENRGQTGSMTEMRNQVRFNPGSEAKPRRNGQLLVGVAVVVALSASGLASSADASLASKDTKAEKALLEHVPSATASHCKGTTVSVKGEWDSGAVDIWTELRVAVERVVAAVDCSTSALPPSIGGAPLTYMQFANAKDMNAAYAAFRSWDLKAQSVTAPRTCPQERWVRSGTAGPTPQTCPQEGTYAPPGGGTPTGRVACAPSTNNLFSGAPFSTAKIIWTNDALKIMAQGILLTDADCSSLLKFFASPDSGPH
jgi:hypothetical protein